MTDLRALLLSDRLSKNRFTPLIIPIVPMTSRR